MASFHRFSALPAEIRQQIWTYSFPELADFRKSKHKVPVFKVFFTKQTDYPCPPCFFAPLALGKKTQAMRKLMSISSETRAMMSEVFLNSFTITRHTIDGLSTPDKPPLKAVIRFNRERDIVFLEDSEQLMNARTVHLARCQPCDNYRGFLDNLKHVAVGLGNYTKDYRRMSSARPRARIVSPKALDHALDHFRGLRLKSLYLAWQVYEWEKNWDKWFNPSPNRLQRDACQQEFTRYFTQCHQATEPPTPRWLRPDESGMEYYRWIPASVDSLADDSPAKRQLRFLFKYHGLRVIDDHKATMDELNREAFNSALKVIIFQDYRGQRPLHFINPRTPSPHRFRCGMEV